MPVNISVSNDFSLISWNVPSTYIEDFILFFVELLASDGQRFASNYTETTSLTIQKSSLSPGGNYTVSVKSVVIGSCMSAAAMKSFAFPPASGIDSEC